MDKIVACKDCGYQMSYVENTRKNEFWSMKVDTWVCGRCNRIVEEARLLPGVVYK